MKNFIRGIVLGLAVGIALFWYEGLSDYFPAIVATIILIGVLIPLESQERRMAQLFETMQKIQNRLDSLQEPSPETKEPFPDQEEKRHAFIPTIQSDMSATSPVPQKRRTVDRSLEDVAKKLSSMQGKK